MIPPPLRFRNRCGRRLPTAGPLLPAGQQVLSAFYGTHLTAHLTQLGVRTLIICGETTSGCVRASAVDAFSIGFHVVLVEECCFDRSLLSHKANLFDMHHKYVDVMHLEDVVRHLDSFYTVAKESTALTR